jgi:S-formylglutathione hydrolase FrmB
MPSYRPIYRRLAIMASMLWLCACQARPAPAMPTLPPPAPRASATPPPTPACSEPGTVRRARVEQTARGYPYNYQIYLPPCYDEDATRQYPVVYLLPGRGGGPGQWFAAGAATAADDAILGGMVAPLILVSTETIDADPKATAIFDDLVPAIEREYRALADRAHRAVAGGSLGGTGAYRLALAHPNMFASAGLFGAGLISGEEAQLEAWLRALPETSRPRFFFNTGFGDPLMLERAEVMVGLLNEAGLSTATVFSDGEHDYGYWVSNFAAYLEWVAEDW